MMNARHAIIGWLLVLVTLVAAAAWAEEPVTVYPSPATKVDKLWVLSPEWLLLANDYMDETEARIYAGNRPLYEALLQDQIKLEAGLNPNWVNLKKRVRFWQRDYLRFSTAHLWMRDASRFKVTSPDDPAYASPRCPVQAQSWVASLGDRIDPAGSPLRDCWNYEIGHYAYVRLPAPLKPGCRYRIVQADGRQADLAFDPAALIVPVLKVNQVGYVGDASAKIAYLGGWIPGLGPVDFARFTRFEVRRLSDGQTVFSGALHKRYTDTPTRGLHQNAAYSGETVYELDFSAVRTAGTYAIVVPGLGRSWPFQIGPTALGSAFYTAARGLFHQRCGCELATGFTGWVRGRCHPPSVFPCGLTGNGLGPFTFADDQLPERLKNPDFMVIAATGDSTRPLDVWGGWHDAADYDRRESHHYVIWDLLAAYELNPGAFSDGQLHLPESGNGIPDLLDEALYGLDVWRRAQAAAGDGGVGGRVETLSHPNHPGGPENDHQPYFLSRATRSSTMHFAASAAYAARLLKPYDAKRAATLLAEACRAWTWARDPAHDLSGLKATVTVPRKEKDDPATRVITWNAAGENPYAGMMAAANLALATGDPAYTRSAEGYAQDCIIHYPSYPNYLWYSWPLFLVATHDLPGGFSGPWREAARTALLAKAGDVLAHSRETPYRHTWYEAKSRRWGGALAPVWARYLIIGWKLTGGNDYRQAALFNLDFHLGGNPLGMAQTTGIGRIFPTSIQDAESRADPVHEPVPGITTYGLVTIPFNTLNGVLRWEIADPDQPTQFRTVWFLPPEVRTTPDGDPAIPLWRQLGPSGYSDPLCNEFTVHETMAPVVFLFASFLGPGWMPDPDLLNRQPRLRRDLDGFFWVP